MFLDPLIQFSGWSFGQDIANWMVSLIDGISKGRHFGTELLCLRRFAFLYYQIDGRRRRGYAYRVKVVFLKGGIPGRFLEFEQISRIVCGKVTLPDYLCVYLL